MDARVSEGSVRRFGTLAGRHRGSARRTDWLPFRAGAVPPDSPAANSPPVKPHGVT